ncbi:hypothetical protein HNY73_003660 [Argiope bruennichi]|uniref:Uncharacterized protein n=1 Tax=Argiope bruennichi TaxID=94029 RepID=A0A8T0FPA6_ARGBR|nr:hypothetical protein HNY73_003660 [Argiope bruennichi]
MQLFTIRGTLICLDIQLRHWQYAMLPPLEECDVLAIGRMRCSRHATSASPLAECDVPAIGRMRCSRHATSALPLAECDAPAMQLQHCHWQNAMFPPCNFSIAIGRILA